MGLLTGVDYFENTGYRLLALSLLEDAVSEIVRDENSAAAATQRAWLRGDTASAVTAQLCIEAIAGQNDDGLRRLRNLVSEEPLTAQRLLRQAIHRFDSMMNRSPEEGSEARMSQYRSMAQAH